MKSPLTISYLDLIKLLERELAWLKHWGGAHREHPDSHRIACKETLLRMLKKHRKDPQLNLNDVFDKMKA